ncbi:hypothetical protein LOTGIDRAFT_134271 [Lottia gigantea]|uniref:F-box domain-containing protein n=1 Tax=Lottia gigantea TaxID=225164 RepID=V3ZFU6_LOTGI|nr:hypothetical protein LOTGIDRAFT_134271 [Lottia gigantea]ESO82992.1 hypothetical protein LOTGIDRAFT_134271 [Lottia gigantea]
MDLPDEIIQLIISYLPETQTIKTIRLVSKRFKTLVNENHFWRLKCINLGLPLAEMAEGKDCIALYLTAKHGGNLLLNPNAAEKFSHWTIELDGGDRFIIEDTPVGAKPFPTDLLKNRPVKTWVTSFATSSKYQFVDIHKNFEAYFYNKTKPKVCISEWYTSRFDCGCKYVITVELLNKSKEILDTFQLIDKLPPGHEWKQVKHTFQKHYPTLQYIKYTHNGSDLNFWAGHYGAKFTGSSIRLVFS